MMESVNMIQKQVSWELIILFSLILYYININISVDAAILRRGNPLTFKNSKPYLKSVRRSGVQQFINHYNRVKDVKTPSFFWGDELEYGIFRYDGLKKSYDLAICRGAEIQKSLESVENTLSDLPYGCLWQPEYGSWMVETVPREPYNGFVSSLLLVEKSMQLRRKRLHSAISHDEIAPSVSTFPLMGVPGLVHSTLDMPQICCEPDTNSNKDMNITSNSISLSSYIRDNVINPHPRFGALTQNIRTRRGRKVNITMPSENDPNKLIHMDAMAFGMGCCCLQITMQSSSDQESRFLHDQLAIMSPLFLALSAATPILKGKLAGTDTRWDVISQAVDDRTAAESGEVNPNSPSTPDDDLAGRGVKRINKSRYSSVSRFIGKPSTLQEGRDLDMLNDIDENIDLELYKLLKENNVDDSLSKHIAHLFIRDPLVIFDDAISLDDSRVMDHFENIQSTNWRTIRWKTPALEMGLEVQRRKFEKNPFYRFGKMSSEVDSEVNDGTKDLQSFGPGWRVEFRPLEIQLTDFENAAFSLMVVLLTRSILAMGYNFYLPISFVEENMRRAQLKDAVLEQKFFFRRQSFEGLNKCDFDQSGTEERTIPRIDDIDIVELTINEIFNGSPVHGIIGLIPGVVAYLKSIGTTDKVMTGIQKYLDLLRDRSSGKLPTAAKWMRNIVKNHPKYKGDGNVPFDVANDILKECDDIGMGRVQCSELLGYHVIERLCSEEAIETYLSSDLRSKKVVSDLAPVNPKQDLSPKCQDKINESLMKSMNVGDIYL